MTLEDIKQIGQRFKSLGYVLGIVLILAFLLLIDFDWQAAFQALASLPAHVWFVAILLCLAHTLLNAIAFGNLMHSMDASVSWQMSAKIWMTTLLTKYIPGGVWNIASRSAALTLTGMRGRAIVAGALLELAISLGISLLIALVIATSVHIVIALPIGVVLLVGLFIAADRLDNSELSGPSFRRLLAAVLFYSISMLPYAMAYIMVLRPDGIAQFLVALFGATAAGMMAFIIPGGLGVRETLLSAPFDAQTASIYLSSAVAVRGLMIVTEAVISLFAAHYLLKKSPEA